MDPSRNPVDKGGRPDGSSRLSICENPKHQPTVCDPKLRTLNVNAECGSAEDVYQFAPWRKPGAAPVIDSCGVAGGVRGRPVRAVVCAHHEPGHRWRRPGPARGLGDHLAVDAGAPRLAAICSMGLVANSLRARKVFWTARTVLEAAAREAGDYVAGAIAAADRLEVGGGHGPLHHFFRHG